jgi:hypothetical protein
MKKKPTKLPRTQFEATADQRAMVIERLKAREALKASELLFRKVVYTWEEKLVVDPEDRIEPTTTYRIKDDAGRMVYGCSSFDAVCLWYAQHAGVSSAVGVLKYEREIA